MFLEPAEGRRPRRAAPALLLSSDPAGGQSRQRKAPTGGQARETHRPAPQPPAAPGLSLLWPAAKHRTRKPSGSLRARCPQPFPGTDGPRVGTPSEDIQQHFQSPRSGEAARDPPGLVRASRKTKMPEDQGPPSGQATLSPLAGRLSLVKRPSHSTAEASTDSSPVSESRTDRETRCRRFRPCSETLLDRFSRWRKQGALGHLHASEKRVRSGLPPPPPPPHCPPGWLGRSSSEFKL